MHKVWAVARREYLANVRTKSFLIAIILVPILMFGGMGVVILTEKKGETGTKRLAVLDHSGVLFDSLHKSAVERNEELPVDPETGKRRGATFELLEIATKIDNRDEQLLELSNLVRDGTYFAFAEISADILEGRGDSDDPTCGFGMRYYTDQQARRDLPRWLREQVNTLVKEKRFAELGLASGDVEKALSYVPSTYLELLSRSETGEIRQAEEADELSTIMMPFGLMMFMFMGLMITTQSLIHGIIEEKMQRIAEVLLGSIPPFKLMMGKLLGLMLVALTLLGIYFTAAYIAAQYTGHADMVEPQLIAWFVAFLIPGIFMFGSLFLAVGSCCNDVKESQSLMMPIMFPMMIPMFLIMPVIQSPNGTFITIASLVPLWAPMMMVMRLGMPVTIPWWQPPVAVAGCVLTMFFCIWMAGRIFRVGMLMQGKPPKIGELLRWAVRG